MSETEIGIGVVAAAIIIGVSIIVSIIRTRPSASVREANKEAEMRIEQRKKLLKKEEG
ncbi:hypothetical protein KC939_02760 [Candidatus Saccharibacteria bacterium]|nr:hypothetical protein [Candidatus Saccharibacteria bacterium]